MHTLPSSKYEYEWKKERKKKLWDTPFTIHFPPVGEMMRFYLPHGDDIIPSHSPHIKVQMEKPRLGKARWGGKEQKANFPSEKIGYPLHASVQFEEKILAYTAEGWWSRIPFTAYILEFDIHGMADYRVFGEGKCIESTLLRSMMWASCACEQMLEQHAVLQSAYVCIWCVLASRDPAGLEFQNGFLYGALYLEWGTLAVARR